MRAAWGLLGLVTWYVRRREWAGLKAKYPGVNPTRLLQAWGSVKAQGGDPNQVDLAKLKLVYDKTKAPRAQRRRMRLRSMQDLRRVVRLLDRGSVNLADLRWTAPPREG